MARQTQEELKRQVLRLFYEERIEEATPSLLVYRLYLSIEEASALLDTMVSQGLIELDSDDYGNLLYRLPPSERARLKRAPRTPSHHHGHQGTDGSVGGGSSSYYQPNNSQPHQPPHGPPPHRPQQYNPSHRTLPPQAPPRDYYQPYQGKPNTYQGSPGHQRGYPHNHGYPYNPNNLPVMYQNHTLQRVNPDPKHSPVIAGLLSFMFPGAGQIYNGQVGKGAMTLFGFVATLPLFGLGVFVYFWAIADAISIAHRRRVGMPV